MGLVRGVRQRRMMRGAAEADIVKRALTKVALWWEWSMTGLGSKAETKPIGCMSTDGTYYIMRTDMAAQSQNTIYSIRVVLFFNLRIVTHS
jgi:hypothetical protein